MAKAFDTVPHNKLLEVLENYGIRGTMLKIFKNYLNNRKHTMKIRDSTSEPLNNQIGIPQGTLLGPYQKFSIQHLFIATHFNIIKQSVYVQNSIIDQNVACQRAMTVFLLINT